MSNFHLLKLWVAAVILITFITQNIGIQMKQK